MAYSRHIIAGELPYKCFSLAIDDNRAAFRILTGHDQEKEPLFVDHEGRLLTTEKLASRYIGERSRTAFHLEDGYYRILSEVIIDKTEPEFRRIWIPGAHFVTRFSEDFGFQVDVKGGQTYFDLRNTAELIRSKGGLWLFDLWVRNPDAPLTECARSITTTEDALVITNLDDVGEEIAAEEVMKGGSSSWLNLAYSLEPTEKTVAPDGWCEFVFKVLDGRTHEVADDVNWDGFIIDPVDGYAPHRRLSVKNGVGRFRMQALGLSAGEVMRVKVGVRFWTSRAEGTIRVEDD